MDWAEGEGGAGKDGPPALSTSRRADVVAEAAGLERCPPAQTCEMINEGKAGAGLGARGSGRNGILVTRLALKMEQSIIEQYCKKKEVKVCRLSAKGRNTFGIPLQSRWPNTADPVKADMEFDLRGSSKNTSDDTKDRPQSQSYHNSALQLRLKGTGAGQKRLYRLFWAALLGFTSTSSQRSSSCAEHPVSPGLPGC